MCTCKISLAVYNLVCMTMKTICLGMERYMTKTSIINDYLHVFCMCTVLLCNYFLENMYVLCIYHSVSIVRDNTDM